MKKFGSVAIAFILFACQNASETLIEMYQLPNNLKEVSGIIYTDEDNLFWTLEDSGNSNKIYGLNAEKSTVEETITIKNTFNIDWEDITKDAEGNLYIGDFGNNDNIRTDLCIYKIHKSALHQKIAIPDYKISFFYPEQKEFPPKSTALFFDVEGFFEFNNNFYLFTKNRSKEFDGTAFLYKIPNKAGLYQAILMGEFKTCDDDHCLITAATISPDASKVALLSHDKIVLFENFTGDDFLKGTQTQFELNYISQKEAICFKNNKSLIIADEKAKKVGGNMYEVRLASLKVVH